MGNRLRLVQPSKANIRVFGDGIFHPMMICLTKTHLCQDATDIVCPAGYVVMSCWNRS